MLLGLPERRWLGLALSFNFTPASYLHESWLDSLPHGDLLRRLRAVPRAVGDVSDYVLQVLELNRQYCDDFSSRPARLPLVYGQALEQLFFYLGLCLRNEELRREILGERIRKLKQALGEQAFTFAVKRAPFLGGIPDFSFEPEPSDPRSRFAMIGARFYVTVCTGLEDALIRRLALKLPYAWSGCLLEAKADNSPYGSDLPPLIRKLIKEILPRWNPLFA